MKFPFKIIDLTHTLTPKIPSWDMSCGFSHTTILDYDESNEVVSFKVQKIAMHAGIGTHIDAPAHCIKDGLTVAELELTTHHLVTQCVVIDVSARAHELYTIRAEDILIFEKRQGKITQHTFVMFHTGWEKHWHDAKRYHNELAFPCLGEEAAQLLLERNIAGIGIDTLSPDRPANGYIVHKLLLQHNKYIVENITNAKKLPPSGAHSLVLPIKMAGLTEAPVRLIGLCR